MCFMKTPEPLRSTVTSNTTPAIRMKAFYRSISNTSSCDESYTSDSDMTLDFPELEKDSPCSMDAGSALRSALLTAKSQGRLTCGIYEAAQLLEMAPDGVMFCVLPVDTAENDVALHIHLTLIEAFCWENDIRIIKVDSSENLEEVINSSEEANTSGQSVNDNEVTSGRTGRGPEDFSCILVEYPSSSVDMTEAEEDVLLYHKHTCDIVPQPVLSLVNSPA